MKSLFVILYAFLIVLIKNAESQDGCYTPYPNTRPGTCINLKQCPALITILQSRPISPADLDYLRQSSCGFEGTLPKVCCANSGGTSAPTTSRPPTIPTARPPVTTGGGGSGSSDLLPDYKSCGTQLVSKIVGGEATELGEFPWMALIEYQKPVGRGFYCGGVLISKRYVLTAAHCVKGKDLPKTWSLVSVRLGEHDTEQAVDCVTGVDGEECSDEPVDVPVEERIAHEQYVPTDQNQYHDIALLRLARNAPITDYIRPICLPQSSINLNDLFVAGWGKTESRSESNIKLKVKVPLVQNAQCGQTYQRASVSLGNGQLCAGGQKGKDSCRGDSGGPLMTITYDRSTKVPSANWFAVGVVSFGPSPCGMQGWPGVYTNIVDYVPWIKSKLRQ